MSSNILKTPMNFFWWLATPLFWWVRPTVYPRDPRTDLHLSPEVPILYVLPIRSFVDLLVLDHYCRQYQLPRPHYSASKLKISGTGAYLYLTKMGWLQVHREKEAPAPLLRMVQRAHDDPKFNVQMVPVSIVWGRNPGHGKASFWKAIFEDDEHAGIIQRFFIVLAQGRDALVHFGQPINLRDQADADANAGQVARKLRRVMRVHFQQQRRTALGPALYSRNDIVGQLVRSRSVQAAIDHEAQKPGVPRTKIEAKAAHYIREISAEPRHGAVRLFSVILTYLFNKIFSGVVVLNESRARELSEKHEVVFMSAHRSHIDYLLLSFVLFNAGLFPPHTAAGINLNFWPIGALLRRSGAFFLRRSFRGNRLYAACFNEYVHFVLSRGYSMNFFPEGGRSRTGKLLPPKTGMLSMVVHSYLRARTKPMVIVPVYIGYDNVFEVKSYINELQGRKKEAESIGLLLRARRILQMNFGKAYVNFGEAVSLETFLNERQPDWKAEEVTSEAKPKWFSSVVGDLADEVMMKINDAAMVSPTALASLAILSTPQRAVAEDDLMRFIGTAIRVLPPAQAETLPVKDPQSIIEWSEGGSKVQRFKYPGGDILHLAEADAILMSYYRNNIVHLFAIPSLIANYFMHHDEVALSVIQAGCAKLYPFLKSELFLKATDSELPLVVHKAIEALVAANVLHWNSDRTMLARPAAQSAEFSVLRMLGNSVRSVLERYGISLAVLASYLDGKPVERKGFEEHCFLLAQRISILSGASEPDYYDRKLYHHFVEMLRSQGYVTIDLEDKLVLAGTIRQLVDSAAMLVSSDIRQSIHRSAAEG